MNAKGFIGAMAAGAVMGVVVGMLMDPISDKQHKKMQKQATNMFKTIGSIVDDVMSM